MSRTRRQKDREARQLEFAGRVEEAQLLCQSVPRLSLGAALQIGQGLYSLQDWLDGRKRRLEARRKELELPPSQMDRARDWLASAETLVLLRLGYSTVVGSLQLQNRYELHIRRQSGSVKICKKLQVGCICRLAESAEWEAVKSVRAELAAAQLRPPERPDKRRPFPQEELNRHLGQRLRILLMNGQEWVGYVAWEEAYSFLLTQEPTGGAEMLVYKTAVWSIEPDNSDIR